MSPETLQTLVNWEVYRKYSCDGVSDFPQLSTVSSASELSQEVSRYMSKQVYCASSMTPSGIAVDRCH